MPGPHRVGSQHSVGERAQVLKLRQQNASAAQQIAPQTTLSESKQVQLHCC
jgi:hypothetical protein